MKRIAFFLSLLMSPLAIKSFAHPGSGIVVDQLGNVFFTDTGKGVWRIDRQGKLTYMPASKFHWMAMDTAGYFAASEKSFGEYFERVTGQNSKPTLVMCSDFPIVVNKDGNIYYANTRHKEAKIIRRTPTGKESTLASDKVFEFVNGITAAPDGSIYVTESSTPDANTIRKITMDGKMSIIATFVGKMHKDLPLETVPSYCRGLIVDSAGAIYVAATGSRSVLKVTPAGDIKTILVETSPWTPTGVAIFRGEIYVLEWHDVEAKDLEVRTAYIPRVRKIGLDGKATTLATVSRR
jgi:streptogramin lyase